MMYSSGGCSIQCPANFLDEDVVAGFQAFYEIDRADDQYIVSAQGTVLRLPVGLHMALLGGYGSAVSVCLQRFCRLPRSADGQAQPVRGWLDVETIRLSRPGGPSVSWKVTGQPIFMPDTACIIPE